MLAPDPAKVRAVMCWPSPTFHKEPQCFLGRANFYHRFIRNYSRVAAPLTCLTSKLKPFLWMEEAEATFSKLKALFTAAPILSHSDPNCQFIMEVDASDTGVGAVLSQRNPSNQKLHLCTFFSRQLSPAEANFDIGNRELLAEVLAL